MSISNQINRQPYGVENHHKGDGKLWSMLHGQRAEFYFRGWGATDIVQCEGDESGARRFMCRMADGWHYAHTDGVSCYLAQGESFPAISGAQAWKMHDCDNALSSLRHAEENARIATETVARLQAEIVEMAPKY